MVNPFVLLPFYAYPSGSLWDSLYTEVSSNPSLQFSVIVNVDTGPGTASPPSSDWITALSTLNSYNNTQLIGYVHTSWAERALSDVEADIDVYADWASYTGADIHMDGIFFDEAPHDNATEYVDWIVSATDYARSKLPLSSGTPYVVLNPGCVVSDSYYDTADMVVAAEDTYSAYSSASIEAVQENQRENSAFIIYSFVDSTSTQASTINTLVDAGITGIYITNEDGYESLSSIFSELVSGMASIAGSDDSSSSSTSAVQSTATFSTIASSTTATHSTTSSSGMASSTAAVYSTTPSTATASITSAVQSTTFSTRTATATATPATTSSKGTSLIDGTSTVVSSATAVSLDSSSVTSSETSSITLTWGRPHGWGQHSSSGDNNEDAGECESD